MELFNRFDRIFTKITDRLALWGCGILIIAMMFYVAANVFARYILGIGGVTGCYDYVGIMLAPTVYLGLAYGWYRGGYVVVDILQMRLKGKVLYGFQLAFLLITLILFTLMLLYGSTLEVIRTVDMGLLAGGPGYFSPQLPWKASLVIGLALLAVRNIFDITRAIRTGQVVPKDREVQ